MKMNFRVAGGFSLVELLAVVAVVGILSSMGYVSYTGQRQAADANKLASDAAVVNRAVALYLASGGSLDGVTAPQEILDKLKADATAESAARRIGLNGTFLDARVKARVGNASGSQPRAVWNSGEHRFDVVTTGGSGVLEFMLDDAEATRAAGLEADARSTTKAAATDTAWIWDYSDPPAQTASRGGAVPAAGLITSAAMAAAGQGFTGGTWTISNPDGRVDVNYVFREAGYNSRLADATTQAFQGHSVQDMSQPDLLWNLILQN
jgi:prepilin-type N-terminal cleavage/methylation domain-containing protein